MLTKCYFGLISDRAFSDLRWRSIDTILKQNTASGELVGYIYSVITSTTPITCMGKFFAGVCACDMARSCSKYIITFSLYHAGQGGATNKM